MAVEDFHSWDNLGDMERWELVLNNKPLVTVEIDNDNLRVLVDQEEGDPISYSFSYIAIQPLLEVLGVDTREP